MKTATEKIKIIYYDGTGEHETKACNSITVYKINLSFPVSNDPTITYTLHNGTEDNPETEYITVPFTHEIVPATGENHGQQREKSWIADVYHCSDTCGEKMTVDDMRAMLTEHMKEKDPDEFSPAPELAEQCATWWNELCEQYPN